MTFRRGAKLDPGQVRDARGQSGGGGLGLPGGFGIPGGGSGGGGIGVPAGGGIAGMVVVVVIIAIYFALNSGQAGTAGGLSPRPPSTSLAPCPTGAGANHRQDCPIAWF